MDFMDLYRGMSIIELQAWQEIKKIPQGKNFTANQFEALTLGKRYTLVGRPIVLEIRYDELLFEPIIASSDPDGIGLWFLSNREISLDEVAHRVYEDEALPERRTERSLDASFLYKSPIFRS